MQLIEVTDERLARRFLMVNVIINGKDPNYIRPLDKDINDVFDKSKNKALRHAEITRWILEDDDGRPAGRIAAFVNKKYRNRGDDMRIGGVGFERLDLEARQLDARAWNDRESPEVGGLLKYVHGGEYHMYNPDVVMTLQRATRTGDARDWQAYADAVNSRPPSALRDLLQLKKADTPTINPEESVGRLSRAKHAQW